MLNTASVAQAVLKVGLSSAQEFSLVALCCKSYT